MVVNLYVAYVFAKARLNYDHKSSLSGGWFYFKMVATILIIVAVILLDLMS